MSVATMHSVALNVPATEDENVTGSPFMEPVNPARVTVHVTSDTRLTFMPTTAHINVVVVLIPVTVRGVVPWLDSSSEALVGS
jgi:hypothetical protein